jgi:hypothetical protein
VTVTMTVSELAELWGISFPSAPALSNQQWAIWLLRYDLRTVRQGIARLALKYAKTVPEMDIDYMMRYASAAMNTIQNTGE